MVNEVLDEWLVAPGDGVVEGAHVAVVLVIDVRAFAEEVCGQIESILGVGQGNMMEGGGAVDVYDIDVRAGLVEEEFGKGVILRGYGLGESGCAGGVLEVHEGAVL